jgi:tetratricopeptide (TPR) repeat protein
MSRVEGARRMPWWIGELRRVLVEDGWALLSGLPAVLAGAAALAVALHLWTTPEDQIAARYMQQAYLRLEAKDYETALVCFERQIKDSGPEPETLFHQALTLKAKGDHEQAESILNQLAPVDRPGYLPAHMELARSLLAGKDRTERTLKVAEGHLRFALEGPEEIEASALLGQLMVATGRLEQAEPYLTRAVPQHPELHLLLARMALVQKQEQKALVVRQSQRVG